MAKKQEQPAAEQSQTENSKPPRRSVIWRGEGEPHKNVQIGMLNLELPDAEAQRKGFESEHARALVTNVRGYKFLITLLALMLLLPACLPSARALAQNTAQPELPRAYIDTRMPVRTGITIIVGARENLQNAFNAAKAGDEIIYTAGVSKTGNFTLPAKAGSDVIIVRTSDLANLPAEGVRVAPSNASSMPKILTANTQPALKALGNASNWRFVGIEIGVAAGVTTNYGIVEIGDGSATSLSAAPSNHTFDRCFIHGNPTGDCSRAFALNCARGAVIDSYVGEVHANGWDAQAICAWNGPGPFKITNNYLEAAGENVLFGGVDPKIPNLVPSDIEFRRNLCSKPLSWKFGEPSYAGRRWTVKNIFELKNARRVLADGNILENNWVDAQSGTAILLTPRNQGGAAPWSVVEDVTFTNNIVRHSAGGLTVLGWDDERPSLQTQRVRIKNNLFDDIGNPRWGGNDGLFWMLDNPANVGIEGNTAIHAGNVITFDHRASTGFVYINNVSRHNAYGVIGADHAIGNDSLNFFAPGAAFTGNVLAGGSEGNYPPGNFFPPVFEALFANFTAGDYRLQPGSPFSAAGANIDQINAAIAGTVTPPPAPASSVTLQMPAGGIDVEYRDPATGRLLHTVKVRPQ